MKYIPLTQGKQAIVDDEDYPELIKHKWYYKVNRKVYPGYAIRAYYIGKKQKVIRMHRFLLKISGKERGDHRNGNTLDNRKENLRICTQGDNTRNSVKRKDTDNIYKGIHFVKNRNKWIARIQFNYKRIHSGYFNNPEDAAQKYNEMAKKYFGEFARFNNTS